MLPKTVKEVWDRIPEALRPGDSAYVIDVLEAAGIQITEQNELVYPSTQGTNTPRYQVQDQHNVRYRGRGRRK